MGMAELLQKILGNFQGSCYTRKECIFIGSFQVNNKIEKKTDKDTEIKKKTKERLRILWI